MLQLQQGADLVQVQPQRAHEAALAAGGLAGKASVDLSWRCGTQCLSFKGQPKSSKRGSLQAYVVTERGGQAHAKTQPLHAPTQYATGHHGQGHRLEVCHNTPTGGKTVPSKPKGQHAIARAAKKEARRALRFAKTTGDPTAKAAASATVAVATAAVRSKLHAPHSTLHAPASVVANTATSSDTLHGLVCNRKRSGPPRKRLGDEMSKVLTLLTEMTDAL